MKGRFMNGLVKVTGYPAQKLVFRLQVHYEDKNIQSRRIKGPAIIISNHTSVYDYAAFIYVFYSRTLRYQMAEVLFKKKLQGWFLRQMGGIQVNRNVNDFGFVTRSKEILESGGVVGIFPESRLPKEGEERPLPFKSSAALIALESGVPVIPVYTKGGYFAKGKVPIMIGTPMLAADYVSEDASARENLLKITEAMRNKVIELGNRLDEETL